MSNQQINSNIKELCEKYTSLNTKEINYLISYANNLPIEKDYLTYDIFIDAWDKISQQAIVVWHRRPIKGQSLYDGNVVGKHALIQDEPGPIRTLQTGMPSVNLMAISQEGATIKQTSFPIEFGDKTIAVLILETSLKDDELVSKNHTKKSKLTITKDTFDYIFNAIQDIVLVFNSDGFLIANNKIADQFYHDIGYMDPIQQMHFNNLSLNEHRFEDVKKLLKYGIYEGQSSFWNYYVDFKYCESPGGLYVVIMTNRSQEKLLENEINNELVTIREVHHRVKNNLQTVVSLLRLQLHRTSTDEAAKALSESINRILATSTTHDILSESNTGDVINIKAVINSVVDNLMYSHAVKGYITIEKNIDDLLLDFEMAVPLALIINELVQNSLEHAFRSFDEEQQARIEVSIKSDQELIQMIVSDNGSGINFSNDNHKNLGLQIVESFVNSKLNGLIVYEPNHPGTRVKINFKNTIE
ncbi:hypothetical protein CL176_08855 [Suicoccus acidiformans]|uniref:histidine kinase n=1 Tax=Suicoccus acidiformans TaxID=2036206 RepID=A0A347WLZ4_9LACT|nr:histidine kinase N-terminal domain-containing protein [Suicoccus acidiformans]AXY26101.1 hypothetical protein CL176_08855 [Suicoccus acidiformans]